MGRKILYGILGVIFGFIIGAIILSFVYPSNAGASGSNYGYILCLFIFVVAGAWLGIKFAGTLNEKYGYKSLSQDINAPKVQAFYYVIYGSLLPILGALALIIGVLLGAKIPFWPVALYIIGTVAFLFQYKKYRARALNFQGTTWLKQTQYLMIMRVTILYIMPVGTVLMLILYLAQRFK